MRYFTRNPLERMMMQVPRPQRGQETPAAPKGSPLLWLRTLWGALYPPMLPGQAAGEKTNGKPGLLIFQFFPRRINLLKA